MAYNRVDSFDPLGDAGTARNVYQSPASYSATWEHYHAGMGSPEIEMHGNPRRGLSHRESGNSQYSTTSTLFPNNTLPAQPNNDTQAFLHDPINKIDHTFTTNSYVPYEDHSGRQLRHILVRGSVRFAITVVLCVSYVVAAKVWENKGVQTENQKKLYNTITTGISIALSLNIASAFKDMALNMRWPILSSRRRNLEEVDLILHADSMIKVAKLAMTARRPLVILACASWLFINLLSQAGVAMLSLTYSWDTDYSAVLKSSQEGTITVTKLDHFYPGGIVNDTNFSLQDEEYTAHLYGAQAYYLGVNSSEYKPEAGAISDSTAASIWYDFSQNKTEFIFMNGPPGMLATVDTFSMYSDRTINVTYACEAHKVTKNGNGNGTSSSIEVDEIGEVSIFHIVPNNTNFFTSTKKNSTSRNQCGNNNRCTVVEAFEPSDTNPWYYTCNITVGQTLNDTQKVSQVPDDMALKAGSAIAQTGYMDSTGQEVQIYPQGSNWGSPLDGDTDLMGMRIATFACSTIAGAATWNPNTPGVGIVPSGGFALVVGHHYFFYLIIGLIMGCHLLFLTIVAVLANRVMVGPDSPLMLGLLLRTIADKLEGVSAGRKNHAYDNAMKSTTARYEKAMNGRWVLAMGT